MLPAIGLALALAGAAGAVAPVRVCDAQGCRLQMTPAQLLALAEQLVAARRFAEAAPLVQGLRAAPGFLIQSRFLTGYIAAQTGRLDQAADQYEAILAEDPHQTRVRLELAKMMLAEHRPAAADRQFRLAAQDDALPPEVLRTIRTMRDTIRASRSWQLDLNVGLAPDSNINNATAADSVTVMLGDTPVPLQLSRDARARSGLGVTGEASARVRLPIAPKLAILTDADASGTDYAGRRFDDDVAQIAAGLDYRLSSTTSLWGEGVGAARWFGGRAASRQLGAKGGVQRSIGTRRAAGVQLDVRRTTALFDRGYSGWQGGLYLTYEQSLSPAAVLSVGPFVRHDWLRASAFSNTEVGGNVGLGGELPHGVTYGLSAGASRARYAAALPLFDARPRRDTRLVARATVGDRAIRVLGLSPQLSWSFTRIESSLRYYDATRSRFELTLARYF